MKITSKTQLRSQTILAIENVRQTTKNTKRKIFHLLKITLNFFLLFFVFFFLSRRTSPSFCFFNSSFHRLKIILDFFFYRFLSVFPFAKNDPRLGFLILFSSEWKLPSIRFSVFSYLPEICRQIWLWCLGVPKNEWRFSRCFREIFNGLFWIHGWLTVFQTIDCTKNVV